MATNKKNRFVDRDGTRFVALPHVVLDCKKYNLLSFSSRALLIDIARQYLGNNNGQLVACDKALKPRGWNSKATIVKARKELVNAGFLCVTRQGRKPNRATWLALTWHALDWNKDMEISKSGFQRGAYAQE